MKLVSKVVLIIGALALPGLSVAPAYGDGVVLVSPSIQKLVPPLAEIGRAHV